MPGDLQIQLLYFPGCPNAEAARNALARVLNKFAFPGRSSRGHPKIEEINVHDPATPARLRNFSSPSILVNGRDLEGLGEADAAACRVYNAKGGVPDEAKLEAFIRAALEKQPT